LLPLVGAAGALAIALLSYWLVPQAQWASLLSKIPNAPALLGKTQDLQNKETKELTAIASDRFNKGQLPEGEQALGILLDRGALLEATAIIQSLPAEKTDEPGISYLRGRLAWQSMQSGNPDYLLSDVIRDWENAAKAQPNSVEYHEALGFAYYAQNRPREAIQAWASALDILEVRQKMPEASPNHATHSTTRISDVSSRHTDQEALTIYAGIALALRQGGNDPTQPQTNLSGKASKIYQMVLRNDPVNFQPQALSQNWLWSESAIKDWQTLAQEP
jgi:tetratricopeptide (TPR) repeat protein